MDLVLLFLGMDGHRARLAQVFQLVSQQVEPGRQRIRVPRDIDPRVVDISLQKARADRALRAEFLHASERQVVDQPGLGAVGDNGQVIARDDDPVSAQIARQRQVAGRGEQDGNAIELLVFQQLLDIARNGFLDHRS